MKEKVEKLIKDFKVCAKESNLAAKESDDYELENEYWARAIAFEEVVKKLNKLVKEWK